MSIGSFWYLYVKYSFNSFSIVNYKLPGLTSKINVSDINMLRDC